MAATYARAAYRDAARASRSGRGASAGPQDDDEGVEHVRSLPAGLRREEAPAAPVAGNGRGRGAAAREAAAKQDAGAGPEKAVAVALEASHGTTSVCFTLRAVPTAARSAWLHLNLV